MAGAAVAFLVQKLYELIENRVQSLLDMPEEARLLHDKLQWLQASLQDAESKQKENKRIQTWVTQIREAAFEAEDIIDDLVLKVNNQHLKNKYGCMGFISTIPRFHALKTFNDTGEKLKRINARLEKIAASRSDYGIEENGGLSTPSRRRETRAPIVEEIDVVGIEDEAAMVAQLLIGGEARRCVASIVGMGGLGKTTLAKKVYDRGDVRNHFECFAWVYVSQEYRERELLYDGIKCLKKIADKEFKKLKNMTIDELGNLLSDLLKRKRYLVVVDDIWSMETWTSLQAFFPKEMTGSRIMLTTRNKEVASEADPQTEPHMLRFLAEEEGWELLCKKAFRKGLSHDCLTDLEKVGREMVRKCKGLPLAVVVLGGLLSRRKQSIHEWEKVLKSINWHLGEGEDRISRILDLSNNDLPYYLKSCFLHFGIHPEDAAIPATKLIRIWVAEGFIQERGGETMEEVGEDYLLELIHRSMIQVVRRNFSGAIKECRIHDLLRDLAIKEAKEDAFLHVHGNVGSAPLTAARRLSITHHGIGKYISLNRSAKHLRSLYCSSQYTERVEKAQLKPIQESFKFLRVLYINDTNISELPDGIGDLIHLKHLDVGLYAEEQPKKLPSTLSRLYNLQTLSMTCYTDFELQIPDVRNMKQLRHLRFTNGLFRRGSKHHQLDKLTNLQTLSSVLVDDWLIDDLGKLTMLRTLGLRGDLNYFETKLSDSIAKLKNLRSLWFESVNDPIPISICWSKLQYLETLYLYGRLANLPAPEEFPSSLTKLVLQGAALAQDPMPVLEKLPNLKCLKLTEESYLGEKMSCSSNTGFPKLEFLQIGGFIRLNEWTIEEGAMANLRYLEISECSKLEMVPDGWRHLIALQELVLSGQPSISLQRDYSKIQHIPSIHYKKCDN